MAKILLVDDDPLILTLYGEVLQHAGFTVTKVSGGKDVLARAIEEQPNLILLDVMMPEKDGGQIGGELLNHPKTKHIPVIFLTNMVTENEVRQAKGNIGGRMYLAKTAGKKEIIDKINEVLSS